MMARTLRREEDMPTLGAIVVASLVSYMVGDVIASFASLPVQLIVGTAVFYAVYPPVRRWLLELRNG